MANAGMNGCGFIVVETTSTDRSIIPELLFWGFGSTINVLCSPSITSFHTPSAAAVGRSPQPCCTCQSPKNVCRSSRDSVLLWDQRQVVRRRVSSFELACRTLGHEIQHSVFATQGETTVMRRTETTTIYKPILEIC